ncbi:heptaprenyl diphosphate synthase [Paenibacillus sp. FSL H8-0548]|uniref:heptaprenyl diphosphate synthase component 1 n=1 Tax=Paenibacillus sp. FSL H8-0548 TaxID=1920422 RepID=UPI00096C2608|nr:heptaprenyl diphosphate synthase component 1 [Paenibacillus sp. FSL H8-0548]OMF35164.1 heptaprenyl diphosphate synthase [Paenibacillus sp. FSL H8-0548]
MKTYRIPEIAQKYIGYDMIQAHTTLPDLANARLRLLYAFLSQQPSLKGVSELYTLAVSLVQLGMDTHDLIDTNDEQLNEPEMRSRQIRILAGDYFSATFYQLLAQAGQIEMISKISSAVSEVNRLKVTLYVRMRQLKMTADEYLIMMRELRSTMFLIFSDVLEGEHSRIWPELLSGISSCEVMLDEIARSKSSAAFDRSWAYWHVMQVGTEDERQQLVQRQYEPNFVSNVVQKYNVNLQLAKKLKQTADAVIALAGKLESDELLGELTSIVDALLNKQTGCTPALNETR